jgi:hypothetical protein
MASTSRLGRAAVAAAEEGAHVVLDGGTAAQELMKLPDLNRRILQVKPECWT